MAIILVLTHPLFVTPAEALVTQLSFSHIVEIMTVDDPTARYFYETECMKCCWSVKELRRQISTNLYVRCGLSKKPELLLAQTEHQNEMAGGVTMQAQEYLPIDTTLHN